MPGGDDSAQLLELHRRLLTGDRTASEEVVRLLHASLTQEVAAQFRQTDQHIIWDGVIDAMLDYCARPQQFDAERGVSLKRFLRLAACGYSRHRGRVHPNDLTEVGKTQAGRYPRAPVAALGAVAPIAQHIGHQLGPDVGDASDVDTAPGRMVREAVARHGGGYYVEGICRGTAMAGWIG